MEKKPYAATWQNFGLEIPQEAATQGYSRMFCKQLFWKSQSNYERFPKK